MILANCWGICSLVLGGFVFISPGRPSPILTCSRTCPRDSAPQQVVQDWRGWLNCGPWNPGSTSPRFPGGQRLNRSTDYDRHHSTVTRPPF